MNDRTQYQRRVSQERVQCLLCPHMCRLREGQRGACGVRINQGGEVRSLNYGRVTSIALDPTEKKPLYHFHPGSYLLSLGSLGCSMSCGFCQNWEISQGEAPAREITPDEVVTLLDRSRPQAVGVAYTYSEPLMWYEFVLAAAEAVRRAGYVNVLVTNGFINPEPLAELLKFTDALNVDLKALRDDFYRRICRGRLDPVLRAVEMAKEAGCHVEVTNLLIPGLNDSDEDIHSLVDWVADLDPSIPLHFSRYYPGYRMNRPPTPVDTLKRARDLALQRLSYVYIGNAPQAGGSDTHCPSCGVTLIERSGYDVEVTPYLAEGRCRVCGADIEIITEVGEGGEENHCNSPGG